MPYVNLPANLQGLFATISERLRKLENGQRFTIPNVPVLTSQPTVTGSIASDPTSPRVGDLWLNTDTNEVKYVDDTGATQIILPAIVSSPPGIIMAYGGTTAPTGWVICNGGAYSRTTYAALFAVLGTSYGSGDGSTTFNVPDLRGRFPVGADGSAEFSTNGVTGGNRTHSHTLSDAGQAKIRRAVNRMVVEQVASAAWTANNDVSGTGGSSTQGNTVGAGLIGSTDATTGAASIPPYQVVRYIIKT